GRLGADTVVVAGGAWSAEIMREMIPLDVVPVRGQMLLFRAAPETLHRILLQEGRYVIPRRDGRVLAGSTLEYVGYDKSVTEQARAELWEAAVRLVPALADCPVENHWSGLRPGSPEGIPFIGKVGNISGLYVNAGHFRNGVVLGPASARLLADLILERSPIVDPAPYAPSRARSTGQGEDGKP
ncbi:MAG TPA: FAD-dependent oxidoreductase, partial [Alphaproteobacteria bacterium]|nr:FAD-dependent oxidoreductase [Alphaproteobacteria bacterium]